VTPKSAAKLKQNTFKMHQQKYEDVQRSNKEAPQPVAVLL